MVSVPTRKGMHDLYIRPHLNGKNDLIFGARFSFFPSVGLLTFGRGCNPIESIKGQPRVCIDGAARSWSQFMMNLLLYTSEADEGVVVTAAAAYPTHTG